MDTLFGDIINILKNPELGGDLYAVGQEKDQVIPFAKKIGIKMRNDIINAKRYHLSSDFSKNAALLAYNVDDPIQDLIDKARVPFESIWLEWPLKAKLEAVGLEMEDDAPEFAGVLIKRINNSPTHFTITAVEGGTRKYFTTRHIDWCPVSIEVDLNKPFTFAYKEEKIQYFKYPILEFMQTKKMLNGHDDDELFRGFMQGSLIGGKSEFDVKGTYLLSNLIVITDYATQCLTPYYGELYYSNIDNNDLPEKVRKPLLMILGTVLKQHAGLYRFVLSALTLLNEKEYINIQSIKPGKSRPGSLIKPKIQPQYDFVTMNAPHIVFVKEKLEYNDAKREVMCHEVTGTWVNYHKTGKDDCIHAFANMDETGNKKICMLCGRRKSWRREHERGNIELGFKPRQARLILDE